MHVIVVMIMVIVAMGTAVELFDAFTQFLGIEAADGVLHDDKPRLDLAGFRLGKDQRLERLGGDHEGRDAALLEFDAVVETPR